MPPYPVGRVVALWRYPVKSMQAESLDAVDVSWDGLVGDRRWAFVRGGTQRSGFPWLTIRELAEMRQYRPWFAEPDRPDSSLTMVRTPAGIDFDVVDPRLAAELGDRFGGDVHVLKQSRGIFDTMPLSLVTTRAVASLGAVVHADLDVQRFRPNLVIEATGDGDFPEDAWVGRVLQLGDADTGVYMRVDKPDRRCVVVTIDPSTNARDPNILRAIARERDSCFGVYGSAVKPGHVVVGDPVTIRE